MTGAGAAGDGRAPKVALGALAALAILVFFDLVFRGHVLYERDLSTLFWGQCEAFVNVVAGGAWPVWDPYQGFGQPMLANPGTQIFYPLTWLNLVMRPETYTSLYALVHLLLAGAGMLMLGRVLRLSWPAATTAAAVWMVSGPLLSSVDLWQHFAGASWTPWVVAAAVRALEAPSLPRTLVWAMAQSAQVLTGSLDLVVLTAVPQLGVLGSRLDWRHIGGAGNRRVLGVALLAAVLTVAWTAALWLPAGELLGRSGRAELSEGSRVLWSVPAVGLLQTLVPVLPEDLPLSRDVRRLLFDGREPLLSSLYLGLPALALVLAAAVAPRRRLVGGAALLLALALTLSLGRHGLAYFWATAAVPHLELLRYPVKTSLLASLAFGLLAGVGQDAWRDGRVTRRPAVAIASVVGLGGVACLLAVNWLQTSAPSLLDPGPTDPLSPGTVEAVLALPAWSAALALGAALVAVLAVTGEGRRLQVLSTALAIVAVVDLFVVHRGLNPTVPRAQVQAMPAAAVALRSDRARRVFAFDYLRRPRGKPSLRPPQSKELLEMPLALRHLTVAQAYPTGFPRFGLRGSYDLDIVGLNPRERKGLRLLVLGADRELGPLVRLLQVGGVTHVVSLHRAGLEALPALASFETALVGDVHVFRVPTPLPLVSVVGATQVAAGLPAYEALLSPSFDPTTTVLFPAGEARALPADFAGTARLEEERGDRLRARVSSNAPATLVLPEGFDDDWTATVDGREAPVLRGNVAFRAVPVPAGDHEVTLAYRPSGLRLGLALSLLSIAAALGILLVGSRALKKEGAP